MKSDNDRLRQQDEPTTTITVSEETADALESRVCRTSFEDVDEYAEFVLSELLTRIDRESNESESNQTEEAVAEEEVQERLESLGYLEE